MKECVKGKKISIMKKVPSPDSITQSEVSMVAQPSVSKDSKDDPLNVQEPIVE